MAIAGEFKLTHYPNRIKISREKLNLSQTALAEKCGLTPVAICQYESGKRKPNYYALIGLSNTLNVTTDYLILGHNNTIVRVVEALKTLKNFCNGKCFNCFISQRYPSGKNSTLITCPPKKSGIFLHEMRLMKTPEPEEIDLLID